MSTLSSPFSSSSRSEPQGTTNWANLDFYMIICMLVLMGFGLVTIWSAGGGGAITPSQPVFRQILYVIIGIPVLAGMTLLDFRYVKTFSWVIYAASLALLASLTVAGTTIGGSTRWLYFGPISIQPSEIAKLAVIISLAVFIADRRHEMDRFVNFALSGVIVAIPAALVYLQPDLGTTGVFAFIWLMMTLISRTRIIYVIGTVLLSIPAALFAWAFLLQDYMRDRLMISFYPERDMLGAGYNIIQAQISIGSGGLLGHGLTGGSQSQMDLLRVRTTDFIFAHAMGMFGFIGAIALFVVIGLLLWRTMQVAQSTQDPFGQMLAAGITAMIFFQAFVNIGMNVGLLPVTGIPLPFVSLGGSSLWVTLAAIGLLQSVRIHHQRLAFQRDWK
jgi:rod shape determining protein RodA